MALSASENPVGFFDMPLEIRRQIYHDCLVRQPPIEVPELNWNPLSLPRSYSLLSLLRVSKKIYEEASEVFYRGNTFQINIGRPGQDFFQKNVTEDCKRKMRKIMLMVRPLGHYRHTGFTLDPTLWSPLLSQLTELYMRKDYVDTNSPHWAKRLKPLMCYTGQQLPERCFWGVDDHIWKQTSAYMEDCYPGYCRKLTTTWWSDLIVRKVKYSLDSEIVIEDASCYLNETISWPLTSISKTLAPVSVNE